MYTSHINLIKQASGCKCTRETLFYLIFVYMIYDAEPICGYSIRHFIRSMWEQKAYRLQIERRRQEHLFII